MRCIAAALAVVAALAARYPPATGAQATPVETRSCFLLMELGRGEVARGPSEACATRLTPASTFKVPHALAALDAGIVKPDEVIRFDGTGDWPESARHDHTFATALPNSVVWFFQRLATRLGPEREAAYLRRFAFGNMDSSSGLTTFWLAGSLEISPEEQAAFWSQLYAERLPVSRAAATAVRAALIEPNGTVMNAAGRQPFGAPWPDGVVVSAKTGSITARSGGAVRWLVGHVANQTRAFVFVSAVTGPADTPANAAIDLAAVKLRATKVL